VQFGIYTVYEFRHWKPDPFVITQGSGSVKMESFTDEEIRLRAAPGSKGKLRLNVSWFPRWHAYRDGKRVSLWWTMGVNRSHEGVRLAQALINIALITQPAAPTAM